MSSASNSNPERLHELLADQALQGLNEDAARELDALLVAEPAVDVEAFERAAAALDQAIAAGANAEPLPSDVRKNLASAAHEWIATGAPADSGALEEPAEAPAVLARISWMPWFVAAASLTIATFVWITGATSRSAQPVPVAVAYDTFLNSAPADLVRVEWQVVAKNYDIPSDDFSGEVVWSGSAQQGYMVFDGLPPNDPGAEQFQLWIFDSTRGDSPPVDGGVFDVDSTGRVIVPIRPAIAVRNATAFAVTIEEPGGVVVSTQNRIATLAPVEQI